MPHSEGAGTHWRSRLPHHVTPCVPVQVDYRWSGDANIFLAIELPAGGSATRMVPKVSNLAVRWAAGKGACVWIHG